MYTFEERLHYRNYVTARLTRKSPIYDWYVFPHSFSKELVHELLEDFGATTNSMVYDPFVGAGTTLLACREKNIKAFGTDQLPFSVFVSSVKVRNYAFDELQQAFDKFTPLDSGSQVFGTIPIIERAFTDEVKTRISSIYNWIQSLPKKQADFFLLALLFILEDVSQTQKSGGWLRFIKNKTEPNAVEELFKVRARKMMADLNSINLPSNLGFWHAVLGDARLANNWNQRFNYVISSPPYLNRHDYTRVFALEMALHFVDTNRELINLRTNAFRSHVEAKSPAIERDGYIPPDTLRTVLTEVGSRVRKQDKKRIPTMIEGYFEDMYLTLDALYPQVEANGKVAFVLGNVRFSGMMILVDEIVAEIGEQVGFTVDRIIVTRYRGNSAQQMAKYGREPARESIIIFDKIN